MNRSVRELIAKVECIGWRYDGYDGNNHVRLVNDNGEVHSIPATPSEYRSLTNVLSHLERLAGRKLPRANHRRSRKAFKPSGFSIAGTHNDSATTERIADLVATHQQQRDEWESLITNLCRESAARARDLLSEITAVEDELERLYQPVDRIAQ